MAGGPDVNWRLTSVLRYAFDPSLLTEDLVASGLGSVGVTTSLTPEEQVHEGRRRRARRRFRKAAKTIIVAQQFKEAGERAAIQRELDGDADDDVDDDDAMPALSSRVCLAVFTVFDTVCSSLCKALIQYPGHFLSTAALFGLLSHKYKRIEYSYQGGWAIWNEVGLRTMYQGFAAKAAMTVLSDLVKAFPRIYTALTWTQASKTVSRVSFFLNSALTAIPTLALAQVWAGSTTAALLGESVASTATTVDPLSLPWWVLARQVIKAKANLPIVYLLPTEHPFAERRCLQDLIAATPKYFPRFVLMPFSLLPVPDLVWFEHGWSYWNAFWWGKVFGSVIGLPIRAVTVTITTRIGKYFAITESSEDHLERHLENATKNVASVRGRVDVKTVTQPEASRPVPHLERQTTIAIKTKAALDLAEKRTALLQRVKKRLLRLKLTNRSSVSKLVVDRTDFRASLKLVSRLSVASLVEGNITVKFENESGIDAGGLFRDYMSGIAKCCIEEKTLFAQGPDAGFLPCKQPDDDAHVAESMWKEELFAVGRLMALAAITQTPLEISFSRCVYKVLLGERITQMDVARIDPDFAKHRLGSLLKQGGVAEMEAILCDELYFVGASGQGDSEDEELVPGGAQLRVTEANKKRYVALLTEHYFVGHIRKELAMLIEGFRDVIPRKMLNGEAQNDKHREWLTGVDLDLLVAGMPHIDVKDWQKHCGGSFDTSRTLSHDHSSLRSWFWELVGDMTEEDRAKLLSFSTGSSRVPAEGFRTMTPMFNVSITAEPVCNLPTAHTCGNNLCLPLYSTKDQLRERLEKVLSLDAGFGFM